MNEQCTVSGVLRVCLVTQGISPVVAPLHAAPHVKLISIIESAPRSERPTPSFKQRLSSLYSRCSGNSLQAYAKARDLPYVRLTTQNMDSVGEWLQAQNCDVILVNSMSQLLPASILDIPRFGTLNLHPSMLPAYRGPNPIFWMYYNAETVGGVTLHYLDAGEDTGDIIYQTPVEIRLGMRASELLDIAIGKHGVQLALTALKVLADGGVLPRTMQVKRSPTKRARRVSRDNLEEYRKVIDWQSWHVERVWHFLRAGDAWVDALDPPCRFALGQRWTVLGYERKVISNMSLGSIQKIGAATTLFVGTVWCASHCSSSCRTF